MPQVCFLFATDAKGQTLYEHVQANPQLLLGLGLYEHETQETRHGAHTGSGGTPELCRRSYSCCALAESLLPRFSIFYRGITVFSVGNHPTEEVGKGIIQEPSTLYE